MTECCCTTPPFHYTDFDSAVIGVDETNGRFGEVSIETCRRCGSKWLRYFAEFEGFTKSGRWYRGLLSEDAARSVTPETAVAVLEALEWRFVGGSYFESSGFKSSGSVFVDL
jgi:hypothetical protein